MPPEPIPSRDDVLDALILGIGAVARFVDLAYRYARRPTNGVILVNERWSADMAAIKVHKFDARVVYFDDLGGSPTAATTWDVVDFTTDAPATDRATLTVDPANDQHVTGEIVSDTEPSFKLRATAGNKKFESGELQPDFGAVSTAQIDVTPV